MNYLCVICKKVEFNLDRRLKHFGGNFVVVCKRCKYSLNDFFKISISDRRSQIYGHAKLKGAELIIKDGHKLYVSSCQSDYDLRLKNKKWESIMFNKKCKPIIS